MLSITEIGPAERGDLKLGLLPGVVAGGGTLDAAIRNFVGRLLVGNGQRKSGLQQHMGLVPVDVVADHNLV